MRQLTDEEDKQKVLGYTESLQMTCSAIREETQQLK